MAAGFPRQSGAIGRVIRSQVSQALPRSMMHKHIELSGFQAPARHKLGRERRTVIFAELVAGVALAVCTVVVATVLSVGTARASVADGVIGHEGSLFGIALLLGLIFIGLGGLSALADGKRNKN